MEIKEILSKLEYNTGSFPYEAVQEAIKKKEEIIPELLKVLENTERNIDAVKEEPNYLAHIYAMYLLAQFREKRAYPLIFKLFSHSSDTVDRIAGEFIAEDLARVLALVCQGDLSLIKALIENREINEFVRSASLRALVALVVHGIKPRDEILNYFKSLFCGKLEKKPSLVWDSLVSCGCDLHPREVSEEIEKAYQENLVDPSYICKEDVMHYLKMGRENNLEDSKKDVHLNLIDDTVSCMEWWACFQPEEKRIAKFTSQIDKPLPRIDKPQFKVWKPKKIGRNQLCPCGSGKKYKKCCGSTINLKQHFVSELHL